MRFDAPDPILEKACELVVEIDLNDSDYAIDDFSSDVFWPTELVALNADLNDSDYAIDDFSSEVF